jgi:hypothetical protein
MAELQCVDGSVLTVLPVPVLDREGVPYEARLRLLRDGEPFGGVGECSAWQLARLAELLHDPDDPPPAGVEALLASGLVDRTDPRWPALQRSLPRDRELLCLRARDPDDDLGAEGELRVELRDDRAWRPGAGGTPGRWVVRVVVVVDAWGASGAGLRARTDVDALRRFVDVLIAECVAAGAREQARA